MVQIAKELGYTYITFDSINEQATALSDPIGFIASLSKPVILDEVQRAVSVFLPIKVDVDQHPDDYGRYALTGSTNPLLAPKLGDALTGRMALLHLWPLSQGELVGQEETFLEKVFNQEMGKIETIPNSKEDLIDRLLLGGFPLMHKTKNEESQRAWCDAYLSLTLQKDIQQLAQIEGLAHMPQLLHVIATRVGAILNYSNLAVECQIPVTSFRRYLALLQNLFLLHAIPAWSLNLGKRLIKSPKIYFVDTAILLHSLRFDKQRLMENPLLVGKVVENFVVNELCKQISWSKKRIQIFHCRFSDNQAEIDIILEDERGKIVGIEIKASETVGPEDFKHIRNLEEAAGEKFLRGVVLYAGNRKLPFGTNRWAIPISYIWT
jgi:predicted AAA+ superfamily ATPase